MEMNTQTQTFTDNGISGVITYNGNLIMIDGLTTIINRGYLYYWAASPAESRYTYSGSGLPFANAEIAYQNTINKGKVNIVNGRFSLTVQMPNSYYINLGTIKIVPHVNLQVCDEIENEMSGIINLKLGGGFAYRSLTYPPFRSSPNFYAGDFNARSQEQILFDSAYPNNIDAYRNVVGVDFWVKRPAR